MKRLKLAIPVLWVMALVGSLGIPVYAAFSAVLGIVETAGVDYPQLSANVTLNVEFLASEGFIDSDGRDTRITRGLTELPHMLASDRMIFNTALSGNTAQALSFTTGNSAISNFAVSSGKDGRVTIADNAATELGNDFEILVDGWIDTTFATNKATAYKPEAVGIGVSSNGTVTAWVSENSDKITSAGVDSGNDAVWGVNWLAESFTPGSTFAVESIDLTLGLDTGDPIGQMLIGIRATSGGDPIGDDLAAGFQEAERWIGGGAVTVFLDTPTILTSGTVYAIVIRHIGGDVSNHHNWTDHNGGFAGSQLSSSDSGVTWGSAGSNDYEFALRGTDVHVSATVDTGPHEIKATADTTDLKLFIDTVEEDSVALGGASVPDNANGWVVGKSNAVPYTDDLSLTASSSLVLQYQPVDIIDTVQTVGTVDSGTRTTLVDAAALTDAADFWNLATLVIETTTDGLAPVGEVAFVTDFDAAADELEFDALTAAVGACDTFTVEFATVPDLEGNQDGRIAWGRNPAGVVVVLGGLVSDFQPVTGVVVLPTQDILPDLTPPVTSNDAATLAVIGKIGGLFELTEAIEDISGWPIIMQWQVALMVLSMVLFVVVYKRIPNFIIAGVLMSAVIGVGVMLTVFEFWVIAFIILFLIGMTLLQSRLA